MKITSPKYKYKYYRKGNSTWLWLIRNHCRRGKTYQAVVVLRRLRRTKEAEHLADQDQNQVLIQSQTKKKVNNQKNKVFAAGTKETDKSFLKGQNVCKTFQLFKTPMSWLEKFGKGNFKQELLSNWRKQLLGISKATILVFLHEWGGCTVLLQHSILILIQGGQWRCHWSW